MNEQILSAWDAAASAFPSAPASFDPSQEEPLPLTWDPAEDGSDYYATRELHRATLADTLLSEAHSSDREAEEDWGF